MRGRWWHWPPRRWRFWSPPSPPRRPTDGWATATIPSGSAGCSSSTASEQQRPRAPSPRLRSRRGDRVPARASRTTPPDTPGPGRDHGGRQGPVTTTGIKGVAGGGHDGDPGRRAVGTTGIKGAAGGGCYGGPPGRGAVATTGIRGAAGGDYYGDPARRAVTTTGDRGGR